MSPEAKPARASGTVSLADEDFEQEVNPFEDLLARDEYRVLADYRACLDAQAAAERAFRAPAAWAWMSVLNVARGGHFPSDRAIREYCDTIWGAKAVRIGRA
jgi:starch phosphorylase